MNKTELIEAIAGRSELSKAAAGRALDELLKIISEQLADGDTISLVGFGTIGVKRREARMGRNPQTGEPLKIDAAQVVYFKPGKALKDAVNTLVEETV